MFQKIVLSLLAAVLTGLLANIIWSAVGVNPVAAIPMAAVLAKVIIEIIKRIK